MSQERFTGANAALVLIDHQTGTMGWARSIPFEVMKQNTIMLAKSAKILRMPIILTSSMEEFVQGPLLAELASIAPDSFAKRIKRIAGCLVDSDAVHLDGSRRHHLVKCVNQ